MNWLELSAIANKRVMIGLGSLAVCLDKRGIDLSQPEITLSLPPDGERISEQRHKNQAAQHHKTLDKTHTQAPQGAFFTPKGKYADSTDHDSYGSSGIA